MGKSSESAGDDNDRQFLARPRSIRASKRRRPSKSPATSSVQDAGGLRPRRPVQGDREIAKTEATGRAASSFARGPKAGKGGAETRPPASRHGRVIALDLDRGAREGDRETGRLRAGRARDLGSRPRLVQTPREQLAGKPTSRGWSHRRQFDAGHRRTPATDKTKSVSAHRSPSLTTAGSRPAMRIGGGFASPWMSVFPPMSRLAVGVASC